MILAALLASATVPQQSPRPEDVEVDVGCLIVVAAYGNHKPQPYEDAKDKDIAASALQFYIGRLSALDPHTNWAEFLSIHGKEMTEERAMKLAPTCFARALNLAFGDHTPVPPKGR